MTAPHSPPISPDDTKRKTDLNAAHVAAAALAAVTAAVLGSKLGAAGTLIGAAGASVITTVGTAVYQMSLERSRQRVRSLAQRARPSTASLPKAEPAHCSRRSIALRWGAVIVGSLGAFVLAMTVITGFEWTNGQAVGDNGKGTTIGRVIDDQPAPPKPATPPSPSTPTSTSPTPTPTMTSTPTPQAPTGILPRILGSRTSTTTSGGDEPTPTGTSDKSAPSKVTPTPSPIAPGLSGGGG
ncbi:MAG: hypothetical protein LC749_20095 [Actinobacteria bacterium]|nr:hypothetical protein [Actinomycetota bacterium]